MSVEKDLIKPSTNGTMNLNPRKAARLLGAPIGIRILIVLFSGLAIANSTLGQPAAPLPPDENAGKDTVTLEKFQVTGSHISGIDAAGLNPVTSISRATLDMGGYTNVGDALRTLSFVTGSSLIPAGS